MKRLLLFAYFYPPLGGAAIQRPCKMIKYLKQYGWETDVISVKDILYASYDESAAQQCDAARVFRTFSLDPMALLKRCFFLKKKQNKIYFDTPESLKRTIRDWWPVDPKIGWIPFAIRCAQRCIHAQKYDAVMATMGPFSAGIAATYVSKKYDIPLFLDYRDAWTTNPYSGFPTFAHKKIAEYIEKRYIHSATGIFTAHQSIIDALLCFYGSRYKKKCQVIYNAWDHEEFQIKTPSLPTDELIVTYAGGFYGNQTPEFFLDALESLAEQGGLPANIRIQFIGNFFSEIEHRLACSPIKKYIHIFPHMPHNQVIKQLLCSHVLIVFISSEKSAGVIPGKIFEYLRTGHEMLAMLPPHGEAAAILRTYGYAHICAMEDVENIQHHFMSIYHDFIHGQLKSYEIDDRYSRRYQTKKMCEFMEMRIKNNEQ